jgi:signal transduction histidine kinase
MMNAVIGKLQQWIFSLQGKFILVAFVCILIFTTIGNFIVLSREEKLYRQDIIHQGKILAEISRLMLTNVMVFNELGMMDNQDLVDYLDYFIMNLIERDLRVKYVAILDNTGKVLAHNNISEFGKTYRNSSIEECLYDLKTKISFDKLEHDTILKITTPLNIDTKNWGIIQVGLSTAEVQESINALKKNINMITTIFSILSLIIVSIGAKVLAKPVIRLTKTMDGIRTHGDFEQQNIMLDERLDEIGKLQNSFRWMLRRLWEADQERKKTWEVLSQTEKMVSIGRLAAGVAHEINNPLAGITLCFKNLVKNDVDQYRKQQLIDAVDEGFIKIKLIVDQLLDFSRARVADKKPANLNALIEKMLVLFKYNFDKDNITVIKDLSPALQESLVDENKMTQVFTNIIINAIEAMKGTGTLKIKTSVDGEFNVVEIEDTGGGIPPEILPNIFDPFFTTKEKEKGTGLGLSVSKGIVEQHGGIIEVEIQVGVSTTFRIKLPIEVNA